MPAVSDRRIQGHRLEASTVEDALHDIAQREGVAIGVEAVLPEKELKTSLDFPGGTVSDLLNKVVAQSPGYTWRQDGDIIHVSRKGAHVSLTDVAISYPGARNMKLRLMWQDIVMRPEVSAWLKANHCSREGLVRPADFKRNQGLISITAGTMTVAHFLDEVALQSGGNYWAVLQRFSPARHSCYVSVAVW